MITAAIPKLPFIDKQATIDYYCTQLGFVLANDYGDYFLIEKDIHEYYQQLQQQLVAIHPNAALEQKPWQQWEFSLLDPNGTLLTFGQSVD
ncbi:MAG: hypothetical protein MUF62_13775 [Chitinophagaceae bacterium]|nr:hypothetical protein [Chitinophagaceae bacterium]